jgi:hypothetical protein
MSEMSEITSQDLDSYLNLNSYRTFLDYMDSHLKRWNRKCIVWIANRTTNYCGCESDISPGDECVFEDGRARHLACALNAYRFEKQRPLAYSYHRLFDETFFSRSQYLTAMYARAYENMRASRCTGYCPKTVSPEMRRDIMEAVGECLVCESVDRLEVDHIIPTSRDGCSCNRNLWVLCRTCNTSKSHLKASEWFLTDLYMARVSESKVDLAVRYF